MFCINTIPGQAAREKGYARYPDDFSRLAPGERFTAWRAGDHWEIETILDGPELINQWRKFVADHDMFMPRPNDMEVTYARNQG